MSLPSRHSLLLALALLGACAGPGLKVQDPLQPMLENVRVTGGRDCKRGGTGCPDLPTREPTAWKLTPAYTVSVADPKRRHANRTVAINVSTPVKAALEAELVRAEGQLPLAVQLVEPDAVAGIPGEVGFTAQAAMTVIEEGKKKLWLIEVVVSTCADVRKLRFYGRATKEGERSPPLEVALVRAPSDRTCVGQSDANPAIRAGVGDPVNPRATDACAGSGGTGTLFQICESCATASNPGMVVYSTGRYCNWQEVQAVYGYADTLTSRAQACKLSQVSSRESCEGK